MREDMKVFVWNVNKRMSELASVTYQVWEMTLSVNYRWSVGKVQLWRAFKVKSSASHHMCYNKKSQQWDDEGMRGSKVTTQWNLFCSSMMKGKERQYFCPDHFLQWPWSPSWSSPLQCMRYFHWHLASFIISSQIQGHVYDRECTQVRSALKNVWKI